jgi:predicted GNAT family acetyltransferase
MDITNNKKRFRFELHLPDGEIAVLDYRWLKGAMVLMHTFVPDGHRGKGIGDKLVKHVLGHARSHNLKIKAYCPFASKYMKRHPENNDLLDE